MVSDGTNGMDTPDPGIFNMVYMLALSVRT